MLGEKRGRRVCSRGSRAPLAGKHGDSCGHGTQCLLHRSNCFRPREQTDSWRLPGNCSGSVTDGDRPRNKPEKPLFPGNST